VACDWFSPRWDVVGEKSMIGRAVGLSSGDAASRAWTFSSMVLRPAGIAASIGALGDIAAQTVEHHYIDEDGPGELDNARTARLVAFRALQGPLMDAAWRYFDARFAPLSPARRVLAKVASDQLLLMPPFTFLFFCSQAALDGSWHLARAVACLPETLLFQFAYWPLAHTFTFGVVPTRFRLMWFSSAAVIANAYLSIVNERSARRGRRSLAGDDDRPIPATYPAYD